MRKLFTLLTCCFFFTCAYGQTDSSSEQLDQIIEDNIENLASGSDYELDYNTLLDQLNYYHEHPLDLNTVTREDLEGLMLLNPLQIEALLAHIRENGKLIALEELQSIEGFDLQTIYRILPYVKLGGGNTKSKLTLRSLAEQGKSSLVLRYQQVLEVPKGYTPANPEPGDTSRYLGSRAKIYAQYRYKLNNQFSFGITGDKGAGEQFFSGTQKDGFDFYSAHLMFHGNSWLKTFIIGDYQTQYGQGLTLGRGLAFGKNYDILNIKKSAPGFIAFNSSNENAYMRGVGASIGSKKLILDLFYSNHKIDANVTSKDSLTQEGIFSAFEQSGYHRTYAELQNKHTLNEIIYGGHIQYKLSNLNVGITGYSTQFDKELIRTFHPYNEFEFSGDHNTNVGVDYNYIYRNVNLFGEAARSENGGMAYLNGALISLDSRVGISLLYRHYDVNYQNLFSNALSETSGNANEVGLFTGIVIKPVQGVTLSGYYDQFKFPWLRYLVNAPTAGNDYLIQLTYTPNKDFETSFRIKAKDKPADITADPHPISNTVDVDQANYRFNIKYKVSKAFALSNRIEYVKYLEGNNNPEKGFMIYQDVAYKPIGSRLSLTLRYMIFDSDSYNARIYSYTSDLPGSSPVLSSYNSGSAFYVILHRRIARNIDGWLRYSTTIYDNVTSISTGLDQINGNHVSQVGAELRFKI